MPINFALITDGEMILGEGPKESKELSALIMEKIVRKVAKDALEKRTLTSDE